jgi:hypothetical protein
MTDPRAQAMAPTPRRTLAGLGVCIAVLLAVPLDSSAQNNAVTGMIRGRVVDETTGAGVATAHVEFMDGRTRIRASAVADRDGTFVLNDLPRGSFRLRVTRIGYARALTPYWRIESGEVLTVTVYLDPQAVLLAPLEIRASEKSLSPVLANFYRRVERRLGGTFITREDIERRNPSQITDLLADVPGVRLSAGGIGANSRLVSMTRATSFSGGRCPVQVWIDGMLATRGQTEGVPLDDLATPTILEGIEIYRGASTIPPEFISPESRCGVIALWTRRGG